MGCPISVVIHCACRRPQGVPEVVENLLSPDTAVVLTQKLPRLKIGRSGPGVGVAIDILVEQRQER
jgi:hypothetical protein